MEENVVARRGSSRRIAIVVGTTIGCLWLASVALRSPDLPDFRGEGTPVALPSSSGIIDADEAALAGMLVGQRGQVVVVNLWASWCAPCRAEMPLLEAAAKDARGSATFIGVASNDQRDDAESFLAEVGVTYPNVFDFDGSIARALEVSAYPTTYVFGADGELRARVDGGISEQQLAGLVQDAVG